MLKKSKSPRGLRKRASMAAFTLLESVVACAVIAVGLAGTYAVNGQCMNVLRMAKDEASASQVLQQRVEHLRIGNWQRVTSPTWIATNILNASADGSVKLNNLVETVSVVPYPITGTDNPNTFRRDNSGVTSGSNVSFLSQNALVITWRAEWNGLPNGKKHTREIVTVLGKGGVAK